VGKKRFLFTKKHENLVIVLCGNCRLNSFFELSKDAIYDHHKTWEEFIAKYNRTHGKTKVAI